MVNSNGVPCGLRDILSEHGLWPNEGLIRYCKQPDGKDNCCAVHAMAAQRDLRIKNLFYKRSGKKEYDFHHVCKVSLRVQLH